MSLILDLLDAVRGGADEAGPPIPFTAENASAMGSIFGSGKPSLNQQLDLTTSESTLFSVLDLVSSRVAAVKWNSFRPTDTEVEEDARVKVTAQQNLAVKMWHRPNKFITGKQLRNVCTWHHKAVGEAWMVMDFYDAARTLPRTWWPVRPDRMFPVPDPDDFLLGYLYRSPDGEDIALELDEVLRITRPHPLDPHRGLGAVQTLGTALGLSLTSQQWIAAFFRNDATPGGVIEVPDGLEDHEYDQLRRRWNQQHRGVGRAHRVAILEYGKWVPRQMSIKDMQFPQVRNLTRDQVLEAFRIHKHMLGITEDVNLANATAARETFDEAVTVPEVDEWTDLANGPYLERFGSKGGAVEFCPVSPIKKDTEEPRRDMAAKVENAEKLIGMGADWAATFDMLGLPAIPQAVVQDETPPESAPGGGKPERDVQPPDPAPADPADPADPAGADDVAKLQAAALGVQKMYLSVEGNTFITKPEARTWAAKLGAPIVPEDWVEPEPDPHPVPAPPVIPPPPPGPAPAPPPAEASGRRSVFGRLVMADEVDLSGLDEQWREAVDTALARYRAEVSPKQFDDLVKQVQAAVDDGDLAALGDLTVKDAGGPGLLTDAMIAMAALGAASVVAEAAAQGVTVSVITPARAELETHALVVARLLAGAVGASAAREALRQAGPGVPGRTVADAVRAHLEALSESGVRDAIGAALTVAQNSGRAAVLREAPPADYYASEQLDGSTCAPCRSVDGNLLGTSIDDVFEEYPTGGFKDCLGRDKCRGVVVAVWPDEGGDQ